MSRIPYYNTGRESGTAGGTEGKDSSCWWKEEWGRVPREVELQEWHRSAAAFGVCEWYY
jgi:hypothetical protein